MTMKGTIRPRPSGAPADGDRTLAYTPPNPPVAGFPEWNYSGDYTFEFTPGAPADITAGTTTATWTQTMHWHSRDVYVGSDYSPAAHPFPALRSWTIWLDTLAGVDAEINRLAYTIDYEAVQQLTVAGIPAGTNDVILAGGSFDPVAEADYFDGYYAGGWLAVPLVSSTISDEYGLVADPDPNVGAKYVVTRRLQRTRTYWNVFGAFKPVAPPVYPLRMKQRDDGLTSGVFMAHPTSAQRSVCQRGYR